MQCAAPGRAGTAHTVAWLLPAHCTRQRQSGRGRPAGPRSHSHSQRCQHRSAAAAIRSTRAALASEHARRRTQRTSVHAARPNSTCSQQQAVLAPWRAVAVAVARAPTVAVPASYRSGRTNALATVAATATVAADAGHCTAFLPAHTIAQLLRRGRAVGRGEHSCIHCDTGGGGEFFLCAVIARA